jgi:class 3 adenylate cyclase
MTSPEPGSPPNLSSPLDPLLSRHGPAGAVRQLGSVSHQRLLVEGSAPVEATVVVGDLRLSGLVLREAIQPSLFARFMIGFTEAVAELTRQNDGWFDRFTGDGFIAYWLDPDAARPSVERLTEFCQAVMPAADSLISRLKQNSRNFPSGVGLSLGADAGRCELVRVEGSLTLIGSPVVGATRMAASAVANQTILNVYLGEAMRRDPERLASSGIQLERTSVRTKEYPNGQEAYELRFPGHPHPTGPV